VKPTAPAHSRKLNATANAGERLAKRVAALIPCSRSGAEQYIEGGWVRVDGQVIEEPQHRVQQQTIAVDPHASLLERTAIVLVLHNAAGVPWQQAVATLRPGNHWAQDPSDTRVLKRHFNKLECTVALETGATGLMAFTQDWRTQRKLAEDQDTMEHELIADVHGEVSADALARIQRTLNDARQALPVAKVSINSANPERSKLRFAIKGAHPGLVAYLCEKAQLEVLALRRIRLGRVTLSDLPVGQWRYLAPGERF